MFSLDSLLEKVNRKIFRTRIIQRLKKSYERFLYIAAKYPLNVGYEFVAPTYAVNMILFYLAFTHARTIDL
jgi:hypothetical protein